METIKPILDVIRTLRGENGCAWDRKQTPLTMWRCLAEEIYELEEGMVKEDRANICEELGDVLFQILFIMEIFHETGEISMDQVVDGVTQKMIGRHPHVYDTAVIESEEALHRQWEKIKIREKEARKENRGTQSEKTPSSALDSVPQGMPGLLRAMKVSKCAVKQGFDWENIQGVLDKVKEEIQEFESALKTGDMEETMLEFGDILFSLVNVARFAGFDPETALGKATAKFEVRFRLMETLLGMEQVELKNLTPREKEEFWQRAKQKINQAR
mgnify:CR=1 FL=1